MRNKTSLLLLSALVLVSCVNFKYAKNNLITPIDGRKTLDNSIVDISLSFYGDYDFHRPSIRSHRSIDKIYYKTLVKDKSAKLFYENHTLIDPYGSSLGIYYPSISIDSIRSLNKTYTNTESILDDTLTYNGITIFRSIYMIRDIQYIDYFVERINGVCRLHFWSGNPHLIWLNKESKSIIEMISDSSNK